MILKCTSNFLLLGFEYPCLLVEYSSNLFHGNTEPGKLQQLFALVQLSIKTTKAFKISIQFDWYSHIYKHLNNLICIFKQTFFLRVCLNIMIKLLKKKITKDNKLVHILLNPVALSYFHNST